VTGGLQEVELTFRQLSMNEFADAPWSYRIVRALEHQRRRPNPREIGAIVG
jgi:hypothetical protein